MRIINYYIMESSNCAQLEQYSFELGSPPSQQYSSSPLKKPPDRDSEESQESQYHKMGVGENLSSTSEKGHHWKIVFVVLFEIIKKCVGRSGQFGSLAVGDLQKLTGHKDQPKDLLIFIIFIDELSANEVESHRLSLELFYNILRQRQKSLKKDINWCYPEQEKKKKRLQSKIQYLKQVECVMQSMLESNYDQDSLCKLWKFCRNGRSNPNNAKKKNVIRTDSFLELVKQSKQSKKRIKDLLSKLNKGIMNEK